MLDENLQTEKKETTKYEVIPSRIYHVELVDITAKEVETYDHKQFVKIGQVYLDKKKITADKIKTNETVLSFQFTILSGEQRLRSVWSNFVPNMLYISNKTGKNKLYKIIEALLGRELTQEEEAYMGGKFLNSLVGKQCQIVTENITSGEKTFSNPVNWVKATSLLDSLTNVEKEQTKVKHKEEVATIEEGNPDYIDPDKIPF